MSTGRQPEVETQARQPETTEESPYEQMERLRERIENLEDGLKDAGPDYPKAPLLKQLAQLQREYKALSASLASAEQEKAAEEIKKATKTAKETVKHTVQAEQKTAQGLSMILSRYDLSGQQRDEAKELKEQRVKLLQELNKTKQNLKNIGDMYKHDKNIQKISDKEEREKKLQERAQEIKENKAEIAKVQHQIEELRTKMREEITTQQREESTAQRKKIPEYDAQGIAKIELTAEELKEAGVHFPNGLKNGLTILVYKEGFVQHPPVQDVVQEKMKALCKASAQRFNMDEKLNSLLQQKYSKELKADVDALTEQLKKMDDEIEKKSAALPEQKASLLQKIGIKASPEAQLAKEQAELSRKKADLLQKATLELSEKYTDKILNDLHKRYESSMSKNSEELEKMIAERIESLCDVAKSKIDLPDKSLFSFDQVKEQIIAELKAEMKNTDFTQLNPDEARERSIDLLNDYIDKTKKGLFSSYKMHGGSLSKKRFNDLVQPDNFKGAPDLDAFVQGTLKEAVHHRSSNTDILTVDLGNKTVSYDESAANGRTAHDRSLDGGPANFGWGCSGHFELDPKGTSTDGLSLEVTSSDLRHASLAPLDAIKKGEDELDILLATYDNMEAVILKQAEIRTHGGADPKDIKVDWTYQLLTSNRGNQEKQVESYTHIVRAAELMNGVVIDKNEMKVEVGAHVFNAGINILAGQSKIFQGTKVERTNRDAYLHLTDSLNTMPKPSDPPKDLVDAAQFKEKMKGLDAVHPGLTDTKLLFSERKLQQDISDNNKTFQALAKEYKALKKSNLDQSDPNSKANQLREDLKKCVAKNKELHHALGQVHKAIEQDRKNEFKQNREKRAEAIAYLRGEEGGSVLKQLATVLESKDEKDDLKKEAAEDYVRSLFAHVTKAYMDELYYTGKYKNNPENATLFHTYSMAFERLSGLMSSTGCKSANDRTYVMRLFLAAYQGKSIKEMIQADQADNRIPPNLKDKSKMNQLIADIEKISMSHAAGSSTCRDTSGGWPKVGNDGHGTNNFSVFKKVKTLAKEHSLKLGSKLASDKQKKKHGVVTDRIKKKNGYTPDPVPYKLRKEYYRVFEQLSKQNKSQKLEDLKTNYNHLMSAYKTYKENRHRTVLNTHVRAMKAEKDNAKQEFQEFIKDYPAIQPKPTQPIDTQFEQRKDDLERDMKEAASLLRTTHADLELPKKQIDTYRNGQFKTAMDDLQDKLDKLSEVKKQIAALQSPHVDTPRARSGSGKLESFRQRLSTMYRSDHRKSDGELIRKKIQLERDIDDGLNKLKQKNDLIVGRVEQVTGKKVAVQPVQPIIKMKETVTSENTSSMRLSR